MTDMRDAPAEIDSGVGASVAAADAAARLAGVTVRDLTRLDDLDATCRLYAAIWQDDQASPKVTTELLRALTKAGNYVAGAFDGERLVGACVGFFGAPADGAVHSHIAGVDPGFRGRSVGYALKLHQRAWALLRGASTIYWTFDPLVSRNAYFNLVKLAASPVEYLPNFYGGMHDAINQDDDSDRLHVRWRLDTERVGAACVGRPTAADADAELANGAVAGLRSGETGRPEIGSTDGPTVLVAVPSDIEALRATDPAGAKRWRLAVREVLGGLMGAGCLVTGYDRSGWYVVTTRDSRDRPSPTDGRAA